MIQFYQLPGAWGVSSVSPFCIKLEAFLKMAELPYEQHFGDPRKGPRKKIPWIVDDGHAVADSQRAIDYLTAKYEVKLDDRLTPAEKTLGHALRRMLEEATYFGMVWLRWGLDEGWAAYRPEFLKMVPLPPGVSHIVLGLVRREVVASVRAQGHGRYEDAEKQELVIKDFDALSKTLGDKPYLFGDTPTSFDATAFGFVASLLAFPVPSAAKQFAESTPNLVPYFKRISERYFT